MADSATHAVDGAQDPGFASMAKADKDSWQFEPRPVRDVSYLRTTRPLTLRLKTTPTAATELSNQQGGAGGEVI